VGLSVIIITKNEAKDLPRALESVAFADEVIVLDSGSTDATQEIARTRGARVFETDDWPGFGPQKNRALEHATQDWVLSLDADEWLEPDLANEIQELVSRPLGPNDGQASSSTAYWIRRRSIYIDRMIRFGDWRRDRVVRLFQRNRATFSPDLIHERLIVNGPVAALSGRMGHHSVRSVQDSKDKMWCYNRVAAERVASEGRGGKLRGVLKAGFSLFRGLILRAGLLDGLRGIQLAWFNAYGTYLRYALAQSIEDKLAYQSGKQSQLQKFRDLLHLVFIDHGFLRALYDNRFRLAGDLYRINQPSPARLAAYKQRFGIKTVINLRGQNYQLGWYRLEEKACQSLGLTLVNTQVYSRGLVDQPRLHELCDIIQTMELPAVVHCKSGADRAGFFSVLYRHYRLGEPIEHASAELALKYGHSKSAKTGVLDYFFETFIATRERRQSFTAWFGSGYDRELLQASFQPRGFADWVVDRLLRRE
jgi:glycosyltransferase involved in cell wall biosynthesis/protein tyrosine/serine phosphatase